LDVIILSSTLIITEILVTKTGLTESTMLRSCKVAIQSLGL